MGKKNEKNLKSFNDMPKEEQKKIAKKGNKASQEVRRQKKAYLEQNKTIEDFVGGFLKKTATGSNKDFLNDLGFKGGECINLNVLIAKLFTMSKNGNIRATEMLLTLGGFTGDEKRKNSEEERKSLESKARIRMMELNAGNAMNLTSGDDEGSVVIYLPQIEAEETEESETSK